MLIICIETEFNHKLTDRIIELLKLINPIIHQPENYAAPYNRTQSSLSRQENPGRCTEMRL